MLCVAARAVCDTLRGIRTICRFLCFANARCRLFRATVSTAARTAHAMLPVVPSLPEVPDTSLPAVGGGLRRMKRRSLRRSSRATPRKPAEGEGLPNLSVPAVGGGQPLVLSPAIAVGSAKRGRTGNQPSLPAALGSGSKQGRTGNTPSLPAVLGHGEGPALPALGGHTTKNSHSVGFVSPAVGGRTHQSFWRRTASEDITEVARKYGQDLSSVPLEWLDPEKARARLAGHMLQTWTQRGWAPLDLDQPVHVFEIYAGSFHFTKACVAQGLLVAPPVDQHLNVHGGGLPGGVDLLDPHWRQVVWSMVVLLQPFYLHSGFPCTFWTPLSQLVNKRSHAEQEARRLEALVHVQFTVLLSRWQVQHGRHASIEQPPRCRSWCLDIIVDLLAAIGAKKYGCDTCAWGGRDPGNNLPYHKAQQLASTANLSQLERRCKQPGGGYLHTEHQIVQGCVDAGPMKGRRRSAVSGTYPIEMCQEWAKIIETMVTAVGVGVRGDSRWTAVGVGGGWTAVGVGGEIRCCR